MDRAWVTYKIRISIVNPGSSRYWQSPVSSVHNQGAFLRKINNDGDTDVQMLKSIVYSRLVGVTRTQRIARIKAAKPLGEPLGRNGLTNLARLQINQLSHPPEPHQKV